MGNLESLISRVMASSLIGILCKLITGLKRSRVYAGDGYALVGGTTVAAFAI